MPRRRHRENRFLCSPVANRFSFACGASLAFRLATETIGVQSRLEVSNGWTVWELVDEHPGTPVDFVVFLWMPRMNCCYEEQTTNPVLENNCIASFFPKHGLSDFVSLAGFGRELVVVYFDDSHNFPLGLHSAQWANIGSALSLCTVPLSPSSIRFIRQKRA